MQDRNGDGAVSALAFGDSLTYGVGDEFPVGAFVEDIQSDRPKGGYPKLVEEAAGILVLNLGVPGEEFTTDGVERFARQGLRGDADLVFLLEGSNDAVRQVSSTLYRDKMQRVINVAQARGQLPLLFTIPPACCNNAGQRLFTESYNAQIQRIALLNDIPTVDLARAWRTTCQNQEACELMNIPEGIHPNKRGYKVISEAVLAVLYGIDVFAENGPADLAGALGVEPADITIRADTASN